MKRIRLNRDQSRKWRMNHPVLVDEAGKRVREPSHDEVTALRAVTKRAMKMRQSVRTDDGYFVEYKRVAQTQPGQMFGFVGKQMISGLEVKSGREVIKRELFAENGECQIRAINGRWLGVVRDSSVERPKATDANRHAPRPDNCECRRWGQPHPGRHHFVCQFNKLAPPDERSDRSGEAERQAAASPIVKVPAVKVESTNNSRRAPIAEEVVTLASVDDILEKPKGSRRANPDAVKAKEAKKLSREAAMAQVSATKPAATPPIAEEEDEVAPSAATIETEPPSAPPPPPAPEDCVCNKDEWEGFVPGEHHPVCQYAQAWANSGWMLVDIGSGETLRPATVGELAEATVDSTGMKILKIGEDSFGLVEAA